MSDKILTPLFRGSYVNAFYAKQINGQGEPKFSCTIVLPKQDPQTKAFIEKLKALFTKAQIEKLGSVLPDAILKKKYPIKDGDVWTNGKGETESAYAKCFFIPATNTRQPGLKVMLPDGTKRNAEAPGDVPLFYSGAYYYASVGVYCYDNKFGKGVSVNLSGLMWVKDGQKIGGGFKESDFDDAKPVAREGESGDL